jgi:hypothetical protein
MTSRIGFWLIVLAPGVLGCGGSAATSAAPAARVPAKHSADPRLAANQVYQNIAPDVRYVGDAACTSCHKQIAKAHHEHPHAASLLSVSEATAIERFDAAAHNPFEALGFRCFVDRQERGMIHRLTRVNERGAVVAELAVDVRYELGSGRSGRAYLVERDGFLFESPFSWYSQPGRWDLSPGYADTYPHVDRPITASCLFCHANWAEPVAQSINRYTQPIFQGHGIGCERCHGPGERHVQAAKKDEPTDYTIVNPVNLEPDLREAVCHQCHLQGAQRVLRLGREVFDYRPGLPLHDFWSVFLRTPEQASSSSSGATPGGEPRKAVGHVEQMQASRCYAGSGRRLGCISCHDAHRLPSAGERTSYYRQRCLACHAEKGCSLPLADRHATSPEDSCVQCHMTRLRSADIAHTATTDHRIPRRPDSAAPPQPPVRPLFEGMGGFVHFHDRLLSPEERREAEWDLVVAQSGRLSPGMLERHAGTQAATSRGQALLPRIEEALTAWPGELTLLEAKGCALWLQNRTDEAAALFDAVLARAPERETALDLAGALAYRTGRLDAAASYWGRAAKVSPWRWSYQHHLAEAYARKAAWSLALAPCEKALQLSPANMDTRVLLVGCCFGIGDQARAQREFDVLMAMQPPNADKLREWFALRSGKKK